MPSRPRSASPLPGEIPWPTPAWRRWDRAVGLVLSIRTVVPTNMAPAQMALMGPPSNRPHVIRHLLGLDVLGKHRRDADDKDRQKHAAIAYDQPNQPVTELPKSMVYGDGGK